MSPWLINLVIYTPLKNLKITVYCHNTAAWIPFNFSRGFILRPIYSQKILLKLLKYLKNIFKYWNFKISTKSLKIKKRKNSKKSRTYVFGTYCWRQWNSYFSIRNEVVLGRRHSYISGTDFTRFFIAVIL